MNKLYEMCLFHCTLIKFGGYKIRVSFGSSEYQTLIMTGNVSVLSNMAT